MPIDLLSLCVRYRFRVEIDGVSRMGFREVLGLGVDVGVLEYREGTDVLPGNRLEPGLCRFGPLVLRYGVFSGGAGKVNRELWEWARQSVEGTVQKKNIAVVVLDRRGNEVVRYRLSNAWPSSWRVLGLDAHATGPLIEELTIQYEQIDVQ